MSNVSALRAKPLQFDFENHGCEFLDLAESVPVIYTEPDYILLDIETVRKTLDLKYQEEIRTLHGEHISNLTEDIRLNGLKLPGILTCDSLRVKLQDGNHRFVACDSLGYKTFPVKFQFSDGKIKSGGISYMEIIKELLITDVK